MSRIGRKPVPVPAGVKVSVNAGHVVVEGGKSKLALDVHSGIGVDVKDSQVHVTRDGETSEAKALQGLTRSLINNMIIGVTQGYKKELSIVGVGMKTHSGVAAELFQALAAQHINIDLISTSEIKISVTVDAAKVDDAQRAVHTAFGLDKKA